MQTGHDKNLYEYSVIRYMPRVEREEFVNVGLVMMCKRRKWIRIAIHYDEKRIKALFGEEKCENVRQQLELFENVASGSDIYSQGMEVHERFRWLTAVRSACLTTSRPHPGRCSDLEETFSRLFSELVL